jgi:hypothetical protein
VTSRRVMAARLGPASLQSGRRNVLVYVPETAGESDQERIDSVLKKFLRDSDQLSYPGSDGDRVISFGERYGLLTDSAELIGEDPNLVLVIIDPLADNLHALTSPARVMARYQRADFVITELPDLIA